MELAKQIDTVQRFRAWFEGGTGAQGQSVKNVLDDNRRRYRMLLADYNERIERGLSALASTKSCSIVDNAVIDAIQEYYATDAITFTADDSGKSNKDHLAAWLTELFHLRAKKNGFWVWHLQSIKAGFVDGMEAALVRWRKESYDYDEIHYFNDAEGREITDQEYKSAKKAGDIRLEGPFDPEKGEPSTIIIPFSDIFRKDKQKKTRVVTDTWEVMQLKPGENLLWDFKNPVMDLNRGQWCICILYLQKEEIKALSDQGIFDEISEDELDNFAKTFGSNIRQSDYTDWTALSTDPENVDMGEFNLIEVWVAFDKKGCQWQVSFSLRGERDLTGELSVNDVFFGGRPFDRLPVVLGANDLELWEPIGRGIPKLIAPIEDELTDHRNNMNDMAKQAATGKYRLRPDSDVDLDSLLNDKVFYADQGEVEKLDFAGEMAAVMRAGDMMGGDIASLAPVNMADSNLVGKGNAKNTLGSVQLAMGGNDKKLNTRLMIRNVTFMEPLLRIIAEMEMAFETSQQMGQSAAIRAKVDPTQLSTVVNNQLAIDFANLDFDVEIQINAGLGNVPKQQKSQKLMQYTEWAKAHNIPVDFGEVDKQIKVLNGFSEDQFLLPQEKQGPQKPPPVEYKATVNIDLAMLPPEAQQHLLRLLMEGHMDVTAKIKEEPKPKYLDQHEGSPSHPLMQHQGEMGGA